MAGGDDNPRVLKAEQYLQQLRLVEDALSESVGKARMKETGPIEAFSGTGESVSLVRRVSPCSGAEDAELTLSGFDEMGYSAGDYAKVKAGLAFLGLGSGFGKPTEVCLCEGHYNVFFGTTQKNYLSLRKDGPELSLTLHTENPLPSELLLEFAGCVTNPDKYVAAVKTAVREIARDAVSGYFGRAGNRL
ncbi:MAG: hypothetical protein V1820_03965 [archaeon]